MTANCGAQLEENRSETERASLDFPSDSVHRQSKCCEAALADFWSKELVDQDPSRTRVFLLVDSTTCSQTCCHPSIRGWQDMWRWQQLFLFLPFPPDTCVSWLDLKKSAEGFTFCKRSKHHGSHSGHTYQCACDLLPWPAPTINLFWLKNCLGNCSLECVEKENKCICVSDLFLFPLAERGSHVVSLWRRYRLQKFRWQEGEKQLSAGDAHRRSWENYSLFPPVGSFSYSFKSCLNQEVPVTPPLLKGLSFFIHSTLHIWRNKFLPQILKRCITC